MLNFSAEFKELCEYLEDYEAPIEPTPIEQVYLNGSYDKFYGCTFDTHEEAYPFKYFNTQSHISYPIMIQRDDGKMVRFSIS